MDHYIIGIYAMKHVYVIMRKHLDECHGSDEPGVFVGLEVGRFVPPPLGTFASGGFSFSIMMYNYA